MVRLFPPPEPVLSLAPPPHRGHEQEEEEWVVFSLPLVLLLYSVHSRRTNGLTTGEQAAARYETQSGGMCTVIG